MDNCINVITSEIPVGRNCSPGSSNSQQSLLLHHALVTVCVCVLTQRWNSITLMEFNPGTSWIPRDGAIQGFFHQAALESVANKVLFNPSGKIPLSVFLYPPYFTILKHLALVSAVILSLKKSKSVNLKLQKWDCPFLNLCRSRTSTISSSHVLCFTSPKE